MTKEGILISVVICTYNRPKLLKSAVLSLARQTLTADKFEVIVVDNGNIAETKRVVALIGRAQPKLNLRYVTEKKTGLSYARNRGIGKARGKYVAFVDDDARMPKTWLKKALRLFREVKPVPVAVGGPEKPFISVYKPTWFKDEYYSPTLEKLGKRSRFLKNGESLNGSNMVILKSLLNELGGFDTEIGMKGEYISAHEETRFFEKLWQEKGKSQTAVYYTPDLIFRHLIQDFKLSVRYILKRSFASGQAWFARYGKVSSARRASLVFLSAAYVFCHLILATVTFISYKSREAWLAERMNKVIFGLGFLSYGLGLKFRQKQN